MRENRTYGSEGGEGPHLFPTPIEIFGSQDFLTASSAGMTMRLDQFSSVVVRPACAGNSVV